jgi:hypothetical protein
LESTQDLTAKDPIIEQPDGGKRSLERPETTAPGQPGCDEIGEPNAAENERLDGWAQKLQNSDKHFSC